MVETQIEWMKKKDLLMSDHIMTGNRIAFLLLFDIEDLDDNYISQNINIYFHLLND